MALGAAPAAPQQDDQFALARKRAQQQENANLQTQKDAIARRAAQTGGGVQGAMIKQEGIAANESAQRLSSANEGINAQAMAEAQRQKEVKEGREYQTSERLGSQGFASGERVGSQQFAAGQAGEQRRFLTGEREGSQGFSADQAAMQRRYGTTEREASQGFASGERQAGQEFAGQQAGIQRQFQTGERIGGQEFAGQQAGLQREFQTGERIGGQEFTAGQQEKAQAFDMAKFDKQMAEQSAQFHMQISERRTELERDLADRVAARQMTKEQADATLSEQQRQWDAEMAENKKTNYVNTVISAANSNLPPHISAQVNQFLNGLGISFNQDGSVTMGSAATTPVTQDLGNGLNNAPIGGGLTF